MNPKLKEAIKNSGNNLHLKVAEFLESLDWDTDISAYYCDDITEKPREIDIIASKDIPFVDDGNKIPEKAYRFSIYLLVECKNFKNEIAFRMRKNNLQDSKSAIMTSITDAEKEELLEKTNLDKNHHYLIKNKVAKLYDTFGAKNSDVFDAIIQPIKSLIFFENRMPEIKEYRPNKALFYPIVVYEGIPGFYLIEKSINTDKELDKLKEADNNLIFGLNYSYSETLFNVSGKRFIPKRPFCVDFIHFDKFGEFLKIIDSEINEIRGYFQEKFDKQEQKK